LFNYKLTEHSMFTSTVWTDDHKLLQESNFNCVAVTQGAHRVIHLILQTDAVVAVQIFEIELKICWEQCSPKNFKVCVRIKLLLCNIYQDSSVLGMACMKHVQKHFWKEHLCAPQVFLCALVSRLVYARIRAQLRGNIGLECAVVQWVNVKTEFMCTWTRWTPLTLLTRWPPLTLRLLSFLP